LRAANRFRERQIDLVNDSFAGPVISNEIAGSVLKNELIEVMVQAGHLFEPLPDLIRDDMDFIDRLHFYLPGRETC
jgi:predicted ATP-dependent Lon-type protease